jgi:hypothetical protein
MEKVNEMIKRVNKIVKKVKLEGEFVGKVNCNEINELSKSGYMSEAIEGGRYKVTAIAFEEINFDEFTNEVYKSEAEYRESIDEEIYYDEEDEEMYYDRCTQEFYYASDLKEMEYIEKNWGNEPF